MNEPDRPRRLLDVRGLCVSFGSGAAELRAVRSLDLHLDRGETLAVVGESGSGKSVTSLAIMRLVEYGGGRITAGEIELTGRDGRRTAIHQASDDDMRRLRGADMSTWYALYVTTGTPPDVVARLQTELARVIKLPDVDARLKGLGGEPSTMSPAQFADLNRQEFERFGKLIRDAKIKLD